MASQGPNSSSNLTDDASHGSNTWINPGNAATSDNIPASVTIGGPGGYIEDTVSLIKGGTVSGNNKSTGAALPGSDTYITYGAANDLWGLTLAPSDINAANFGVVFAVSKSGTISHYLNAQGFSFSIPSSATIDGIVVEIEQKAALTADVDHIRITVYYTDTSGGGGGESGGGKIREEPQLQTQAVPIQFIQQGNKTLIIGGCGCCGAQGTGSGGTGSGGGQGCCGCERVPLKWSFPPMNLTNGWCQECGNYNFLHELILTSNIAGFCTWNGADPQHVPGCSVLIPEVGLSCANGRWELVFTLFSVQGRLVYAHPLAGWNCLGTNIMTLAETPGNICGNYPPSIPLTPAA